MFLLLDLIRLSVHDHFSINLEYRNFIFHTLRRNLLKYGEKISKKILRTNSKKVETMMQVVKERGGL